MARAPDAPPPGPGIRPVIFASFIGTAIEWYDFFLYGTAAALVFNKLFFPTQAPLAGTLSAYGTFAVGFVARPVGGAVFGHFGDRVGRRTMLVWSLLIMGIGTALIGVLPTYAEIGVWAPVLLVFLRFAQGIGIGGEWGGAVLMAIEHSRAGKRGLHGSWPQMGVPAGLLLSTGVFALLSSRLTDQEFLAWGWRVPFLLSVLLVLVGLFVRLRLLETPAFTRLREARGTAAAPLLDVLRDHRRVTLVGMGMRFGQNVLFYIFTVFVLSYGEKTLGYTRSTMLGGLAVGATVGLFTIPLWAALSDRVGRRPVYLTGAVLSLLYAFPFFWLLGRGPGFVALAIVLGLNVTQDMMYGPQAAYFSELFGTRVRYSGVSLVYQLTSVFSGGLAPYIATVLLAHWGPAAVATYVALSCAVSLVATLFAPETHRVEV
ncbi:MAG TPA: MFS transporter [Gemmatimonadales bacterium]|jgi:metabolite-proton symporter|nr:MFS transporter [Gemmatimonadales bacterium]